MGHGHPRVRRVLDRTVAAAIGDRGHPEGRETEPRLSRAARYANEAVLPFYVLHEPVIVGAAWVIVRWQAPILAKYLALVIGSFAGTLALYEVLVRRLRVTRFLFGMKKPDRRAGVDVAGSTPVPPRGESDQTSAD